MNKQETNNNATPPGGIILWEDLEAYDNLVPEKERRIIQELRKLNLPKCPSLRTDGQFWDYCSSGSLFTLKPKLSPNDPIYRNHKGILELELFCMSDFKTCIFYNRK